MSDQPLLRIWKDDSQFSPKAYRNHVLAIFAAFPDFAKLKEAARSELVDSCGMVIARATFFNCIDSSDPDYAKMREELDTMCQVVWTKAYQLGAYEGVTENPFQAKVLFSKKRESPPWLINRSAQVEAKDTTTVQPNNEQTPNTAQTKRMKWAALTGANELLRNK